MEYKIAFHIGLPTCTVINEDFLNQTLPYILHFTFYDVG